MKVLYISNGLTHYYNLVLSRLNSEPDIELVVIVPGSRSTHIGEGVYQTRDGVNFRVIELEERKRLGFYTTFKGLAGVLRNERPDVVITIENYLRSFLLSIPVFMAMRIVGARLILKSIPFRYPTYEEALRNANNPRSGFASKSSLVNGVLRITGLARLAKRGVLFLNWVALNLPDAHVNYVEAFELWESYGIRRDKIFITRNSPDTDLLINIKKSLEGTTPILPSNPYRLLHVGRLVEWKRVDMLLGAFARLKKRFTGAELIVVGTGPQEPLLKKLAHDLNITASVTFTGGVYDPRLLGQYYLASSLYVLAGMGGLSINEAMCFGLPVLCSVCDGTEKVLVKEGVNGRYFRDGDEDDLYEKLVWFLERSDQLKLMGRQSEETIRTKVNIRTVLEGYKEALRFVGQARKARQTGQ